VTLKVQEISSLIEQQIKNYGIQTETKDVGYVLKTGDGIATIYGLDGCMYGEMLEFDGGATGLALNLAEDSIGCVIIGDAEAVVEGSKVKRTGATIDVPVGAGLIGRTVNPLGVPLDGKGEIKESGRRPVEFLAPGIVDRKAVHQPLQTGIMAIDAMIPIGKGQRELIIGDRQTGKTSIAIDTILNQKGKNVICIYVAIGQKASTIAQILNSLQTSGAMEYTIIVGSTASDSAALQYIAPYAGCTLCTKRKKTF